MTPMANQKDSNHFREATHLTQMTLLHRRIDIKDAPRYLDSVRITAEYDPPVRPSTPYTPRINVFAITCQRIKGESSY